MRIKNPLIIPILSLVFVLTFLPLVWGEVNSARDARDHVEEIAGSPRLAGTDGESLVVDYIKGKFDSYGLDVRVDNFTVENAYIPQGGFFSVMGPPEENIDFIPLIPSPPTGGVMEGTLVYLRDLPENLLSLQDDLILIEKGKFEEVRKIPPKGIVLYENNMPAWSEIYPSGYLKCPVFTISSSSAMRLIEFQKNSELSVKILLEARIEDRISRNVIATLPGDSDETIIVAAHHDSDFTSGAVNGASGVSVMLETAQELSDGDLRRTVKFVSFGAKQYGLLGSRYYVNNLGGRNIVGVLDIGPLCSGPSNGLRVGLEGGSEKSSTDWFGEYIRRVADNLGMSADYETFGRIGSYGDYYSFVEEGIPATWIYWISGRENHPLWPSHTSADNLEAIDESRLEFTVRLTARSVRKLSEEDLDDWRWHYSFPERFSVFTILTSISVVIGLAVTGYRRYVQGKRQKEVLIGTVLAILAVVFILYLVLISGLVQVF